MKVLKIDKNNYQVYKGDAEMQDKLDTGVYTLHFQKMMGFYFERREPFAVKEKLYGDADHVTDMIINGFEHSERPIGAIFSGNKGLGKSVTCRRLCEKMLGKGYPVILVDEYIPGIANFIDSVEQECVFFFDEFEKAFRKRSDGDVEPQSELLPLFDGTSSATKRLYLVTCNNLRDLDDYLINRPGRFHYHIREQYPNVKELHEYLSDKLKPEYQDQIPDILLFSQQIPLNYDCLRAIVFEVNIGNKFRDVINYMNIMKEGAPLYTMDIYFKNGNVMTTQQYLDMKMRSLKTVDVYEIALPDGLADINVTYTPSKAKYDSKDYTYVLDGKDASYIVTYRYDDQDTKDDDEQPHHDIERIVFKLSHDSYSNFFKF